MRTLCSLVVFTLLSISALRAQEFAVTILKPSDGDTLCCPGLYELRYSLRSHVSHPGVYYYMQYNGDAGWTSAGSIDISNTGDVVKYDRTSPDEFSVRCDRDWVRFGIRDDGTGEWLSTTGPIPIRGKCAACTFAGPAYPCNGGQERCVVRAFGKERVAVLTAGCISLSTDAGTTWTQRASINIGGGGGAPADIAFNADTTIGYAFGEKFLVRTLDGGMTWTQRTGVNNNDDNLHGAAGEGSNAVLATSTRGTTRMYYTTDGFGTKITSSGVVEHVNALLFKPDGGNTFFACGEYYPAVDKVEARLWRSDNGGRDWSAVPNADAPGAGSYVAMGMSPDGMHGVIFADYLSTIFGKYTADGGTTWMNIRSMAGADARIVEVSYASADDAVAVDARGHILHSSDGGRSWDMCGDLSTRGVAFGKGSISATNAPDGSYARYLMGEGGALFIDTVRILRPPSRPSRVDYLYAAEFDSSVHLLNYERDTFITVRAFREADGIVFKSPAGALLLGNHLYVVDQQDNRVVKIDTATGNVVARTNAYCPHDIQLFDGRIYISEQECRAGERCAILRTNLDLGDPVRMPIPGCAGIGSGITRLCFASDDAYFSTLEGGGVSRVLRLSASALRRGMIAAADLATIESEADQGRILAVSRGMDDRIHTWSFADYGSNEICTVRTYENGIERDVARTIDVKGNIVPYLLEGPNPGEYFLVSLSGGNTGIHLLKDSAAWPNAKFNLRGVYLARPAIDRPFASRIEVSAPGAVFDPFADVSFRIALFDTLAEPVDGASVLVREPIAGVLRATAPTDSSGVTTLKMPVGEKLPGYYTAGFSYRDLFAGYSFCIDSAVAFPYETRTRLQYIDGIIFPSGPGFYTIDTLRGLLARSARSTLATRPPVIAKALSHMGALFINDGFTPAALWYSPSNEGDTVARSVAELMLKLGPGMIKPHTRAWLDSIRKNPSGFEKFLITAHMHADVVAGGHDDAGRIVSASFPDPRQDRLFSDMGHYLSLIDLARHTIESDSATGGRADVWVAYDDGNSIVLLTTIAPPFVGGVERYDLALLSLGIIPTSSSDLPFGSACAGDAEDISLTDIRAMPGAATVTLRFTLRIPAPVALALYDMTGRELLRKPLGDRSEGEQSYEMTIDALASGMYMCRLQAGDDVAIQRFIVVR